MATPPRIITPGRFVYLTIRAVNRQFRFVPHANVVKSIEYIFWHCVELYGIEVHEMTWMSNHAHVCLTDVRAELPAFVCKMNSLISRQLNALRGGRGTNFEKGYSEIEIVDDVSMFRFCAYTLANPCAADLVSEASEWKGPTTYHLEYNQPFTVERPACGMWTEGSEEPPKIPRRYRNPSKRKGKKANGKAREKEVEQKKPTRKKPSRLPKTAKAVLTRPRIKLELTDKDLRNEIREQTQERARMAQQKRASLNRSVLGWKGVLRKKWNDFATSEEPIFTEDPRVSAEDPAIERHKLQKIAEFNQRYREAFWAFTHQGRDAAVFPPGTWKMRTVFLAHCEPFELS